MPHSHYDQDFYTWTQTQAQALRAKDWAALDVEHLAEEIESLGKRDQRAVESYLEVILLHLLKWSYQPVRRSPSWRTSLRHSRRRLWRILAQSPRLHQHATAYLATAYRRARQDAVEETGLPLAIFPEVCPWSLEQALDEAFLPAEAS